MITAMHGERSRSAERAGSLGFTLIELMVVLFIVALLSTMIAPSLVSVVRRNDLQTDREKISELLHFARLSAITRHRDVSFNLDISRRLSWITIANQTLPWVEAPAQTANASQDQTQILDSGQLSETIEVRFSQGEALGDSSRSSSTWDVITFKPDGRASDARIELSNKFGDTSSLTVLGSTGEIRLKVASNE